MLLSRTKTMLFLIEGLDLIVEIFEIIEAPIIMINNSPR